LQLASSSMLDLIPRRVFMMGLAASLTTPHANAAEPAVEIQIVRGESYAQTAAGRRLLVPGAAVLVGSTVETGMQSALVMRMGLGTEVRLGGDTELRVDRFLKNAGGILGLKRGAMFYDHDEARGQSDVTVRSPFGLIAARDTRFFAGPSNDVFGVFVERGALTVVGVDTFVVLTSGLGTNIARPGAEPSAPAQWGAARIARAMALFIEPPIPFQVKPPPR
jgi:hypothetical protein